MSPLLSWYLSNDSLLFILFLTCHLISPESTCFWTASNFNRYMLTSLRSLGISSWYSFFCFFHDQNIASSRVSSLTVSVALDMVMLLSTDQRHFMFAIFYLSYTLHNHTPSKKMTLIFPTVTIHFHVGIHNISCNHVVFYQFFSHSKLSVRQILPTRWFHAPFFSIPPSLSHFHSFTLSPPNYWFSLLLHTFTLSARPFFCSSFSFTLSLCVCIYHSTAPNLFKFMASHSTLIRLQQKSLSH
jgi:hypothetical protein